MQNYIIIHSVSYDDRKERFNRVNAELRLCDDGKFVADAQRELLHRAMGLLSDMPDDIRIVVRPGGDQVDLIVRFCGCSEPMVMTAATTRYSSSVPVVDDRPPEDDDDRI